MAVRQHPKRERDELSIATRRVKEPSSVRSNSRPGVNAAAVDHPPLSVPPAWAGGWGEDSSGFYVDLVVGGVRMELRWIPPGRFLMGSPEDEVGRWKAEGPQHEVRITRGFWLGATPCTQAQWQAVTGQNPSHFKHDPACPVETVSWEDCMAFCRQLDSLLPGLGAGLPTEAQWEYACRAGTASAFNDGSACRMPEGEDSALDILGWYGRNSGSATHLVAEKNPNAWGLYDMHGNVWEWCSDLFADSYSFKAQTDPTGPFEGVRRVVRGGSSWSAAKNCRSAYRGRSEPDFRDSYLGFRLVAGQPGESGASGRRAAG